MNNNKNGQELIEKMQSMKKEVLQQKADELAAKQGLSRYDPIIESQATKNNGDPYQFYDLWKPMIWQANENKSPKIVIVNDKPVLVYDMDYYIAESLQTVQAGQDPVAEYYTWVEQAKTIIKDIKTDGTTLSELHAKSDFINFLDDRETDLKRVIALYAGAAFNSNCSEQNQAQEKLKFLTFKMSELRRLRTRVQDTKPTYLRHQEKKDIIENKVKEHIYQQTKTFNSLGNSDDDHEFDDLDQSAVNVATAWHLSSLHILRQNSINNALQTPQLSIQTQQNTQETPENEPSLKNTIWSLSGRLAQRSRPTRRGFSVVAYRQLQYQDDYENV